MDDSLILVEAFAPTADNDLHLRDGVLKIALDQRAFGPRRLVVGFGTAEGDLLVLAHARRTDPPDLAFEACLEHCARGARTAVAFCDERVDPEADSRKILTRLAEARELAAAFGVHLVDWVACDDLSMRFLSRTGDADEEWWTVPPIPPRTRRPGRLRSVRIPGHHEW